MNFQNERLRTMLCAVLALFLVTGSMILPAFAAEQNVEFSYIDSIPTADVAAALWKLAGCSETLPASSAQMVLNERIGAKVDGYISSDEATFILNHDYLDLFLQSHDELSSTHNILGWQPTEYYGDNEYFAVPIDTSGLTYNPDSAETFVFHSDDTPEPEPSTPASEPTVPAPEPSTPASTTDLAKIVSSENLSSVFDEVKALLPVVCVVIVGYIGLRKGISFLQSVLHSA